MSSISKTFFYHINNFLRNVIKVTQEILIAFSELAEACLRRVVNGSLAKSSITDVSEGSKYVSGQCNMKKKRNPTEILY